MRVPALSSALLLALPLAAQGSEVPLAFNLPTAGHLEGWDVGVAFTHRFVQAVKGSGKDAYGLDGYAYAGLGLTFGVAPIKGLNVFITRTADNKTFTLGFQQRLIRTYSLGWALRVERFDEVVRRQDFPRGEVGLVGGTLSLPLDLNWGPVTATFVPAYVTTTATRHFDFDSDPWGRRPSARGGRFNAGVALRAELSTEFLLVGEYVAKPSGLPEAYHAGYSLGLTYRTRGHRFTLAGTTQTGTTPNQIFSGDHDGGPRPGSQWALGFNVVRQF